MIRAIPIILVLLTGLLVSACLDRHVLSLGAHNSGQAGASGIAGSGAAGEPDEEDASDDDDEEEEHDDDDRDRL